MLRNFSYLILLILSVFAIACGEKPAALPALSPEKRVELWIAAVKALDYPAYSELEVNPLESAEFMSRYRLFYYDSIDLSPGAIDRTPIQDPVLRGNFRKAVVSIRGAKVDRATGTERGLVMGNIKLVSRDRKGAPDPWKLHNRSLTDLPGGGGR